MKRIFSHGDYIALDRKRRLQAIQGDVIALGAPIADAIGSPDDVKRAILNIRIRRAEYSTNYLKHERGFARVTEDAKAAGPIGVALALLQDLYDSPQMRELASVLDDIKKARERNEKGRATREHADAITA